MNCCQGLASSSRNSHAPSKIPHSFQNSTADPAMWKMRTFRRGFSRVGSSRPMPSKLASKLVNSSSISAWTRVRSEWVAMWCFSNFESSATSSTGTLESMSSTPSAQSASHSVSSLMGGR